jgi:hypothetical protein
MFPGNFHYFCLDVGQTGHVSGSQGQDSSALADEPLEIAKKFWP